MKRILIVLLIVSVVATTVYAAEPHDSFAAPRYVAISSTGVLLTIYTETSTAKSDIICRTVDEYPITALCQFQVRNNSKWTTLETWTETGNKRIAADKFHSVSRGYTYRIYVTFYVYDTNGSVIEVATTSDTSTYS